ncbi:MAG: 3'(2'),5'-bisphosphate nucleotidase CysQ [Bacteroidales bacterium]|nr:3'(2'),5'-bisphosphate nucleotidase CysQ [Bacteroidales bacterium]
MLEDKINHLLFRAIKSSIIAGEEIMKVYNSNNPGIEYKSDNSPLTNADKLSHACITENLHDEEIPILSEEGTHLDYNIRKEWKYFWLIDPLDGTKEFIERNGEFTVNIALIKEKYPILGVIFVPVQGTLYFGSVHLGAYKTNTGKICIDELSRIEQITEFAEELPVKQSFSDVFRVIGSRSHMNVETKTYIEQIKIRKRNVEIVNAGSALKFCLVAEGRADLYPRFGPTMEWDTAAGHCIAASAGLDIVQADGLSPLVYNKKDLYNPWFIVKPKDFII